MTEKHPLDQGYRYKWALLNNGMILQKFERDSTTYRDRFIPGISNANTCINVMTSPLSSPPLLSADLLRYYRALSQQSFTVVDVETTGYTPKTSRVIEISVLHASLRDGIQQQQTHLINPGVPVPPRITQFTGITPLMLEGAAPSAAILPDYLPWLSQHVLTAHNLSFDYGFLQAEYERLDLTWVRPVTEQLCTVQLARLMLADLPSRSLPHLVEHFQFPIATSHRAAADTQACWLLAQQLLTTLEEDDQVVLQQFGREWMAMPAVVQLLGRSRLQTQQLLAELGVSPRSSRRRQAPMYRRADIERVYWDVANGDRQMSLW